MDDFTILARIIAQLHLQIAKLQEELAAARKPDEPKTEGSQAGGAAANLPADN